MNKYIIYFKQLSTLVKFSTYFYVGTFLTYNFIGAWSDAKNKLTEFREKKLNKREAELIKNEWEAVKYGANSRFAERLFDSIIWPIRIISDAIPYLVLKFNPPSEPKND